NWKKFSPTQLSKLQRTEITKPHSRFSDHSTPKKRMAYTFATYIKSVELVNILQEKMTQEILASDVNA
ncbi:14916_t:CDS:2, partial [Gigaspora rosea]